METKENTTEIDARDEQIAQLKADLEKALVDVKVLRDNWYKERLINEDLRKAVASLASVVNA